MKTVSLACYPLRTLTAKDRPYKKPMPMEVALSILKRVAEEGDIDLDILELMIREKVHEKFETAYEANQNKNASEESIKSPFA